MITSFETFDSRADGKRRQVEVSRRAIVISRRLGGVEMRVALAPRSYRGVALTVLIAEATDFLYAVRLVHADPELDVTLAHCGDELEAQALWRRWSTVLALPRLIERASGEYETDRQPAAAPTERRRGRATMRRRNRFLARRKMGASGGAAMVARACEAV